METTSARTTPASPRENLSSNRDRFAPLMAIAKDVGLTAAQLALAWLLHQGQDLFRIPGTRRAARVEENAKAADIRLAPELIKRINELERPGLAAGATLV